MNTPVCVPQNPAQPDQAIYGLSALETVPGFTRESYLATFGVQAPNFDAGKPPKYWFDSTADTSAAGNVAVYLQAALSGLSARIIQMQMPASAASAVNIPGRITYPAYVIAPTSAAINGQPINADVLSSYQDAVNLAASWALGGSAVFDGDPVIGPFAIVYPASEPRRQWMILFQGVAQNVGVCIAAMYGEGIGHPGAWDLSGAEPLWKPAPDPPDGITTGVPQAGSEVPVPVRALLPNEQIITTLGGAMVARTDMSSAATDGGGFGAADRATLLWIQQALKNSGLS